MDSILVGAAIILIPLGLFLFIMARDLRSEEKSLMQRVVQLQRTCGLMKSETEVSSSITDGMGLDEGDANLVRNISAALKAENMIADDLASAFNKVIRIRNNERATLRRKIKKFKMYSIITVIMICILLGLLLFVSASRH